MFKKTNLLIAAGVSALVLGSFSLSNAAGGPPHVAVNEQGEFVSLDSFQTAESAIEALQPRPFTIDISQERLDTILEEVRAYIPQAPLVDTQGEPYGWRFGADQAFINDLAAYWANDYDWAAAEARLNDFDNFLVEIDGKDLHYIHERGSGENPQPLLLIHGWPYSALSYVDLIEQLAHPERFGGDAEEGYDVVVISVPGIGFSEAPDTPEGLAQLGERYHTLMTDVLGYDRYIVSGGDQGAISATFMAVENPDEIAGLNVHMLFPRQAGSIFGNGSVGEGGPATEAEQAFIDAELAMGRAQMDYFNLHVSRGETLGVALDDSPIGAAAWIAEKYYFWTDQRERSFEEIISKEQLLDEIMMYVATDSLRTSLWPYMAFQLEPPVLQPGERITVPYGVQQWEDPIHPRRPREFVERSATDIAQFTNMPRGGHFPFYEEPELLVEDLLTFGAIIEARDE